MRRGVVVAMLCVAQIVSAQIRIIPQAQLEAATPQAQSSTLQFMPNEVSFGTIEEMSGVWQGSAKLVNRSADTLALTQIKTTCGCLKAEVQKRVLAPNESVAVALKYYPRGHAGRVSQRVLLYTNGATESPSAILTLRGLVTASEDRSDDYPYSRGVLRLRQEVVQLQGDAARSLYEWWLNKVATCGRCDVAAKGCKGLFRACGVGSKAAGRYGCGVCAARRNSHSR